MDWGLERGGLVRGFVWKARFLGGPVFEWWTPEEVSRKVARKHLLEVAAVYDREEMDSMWVTKGVR